MKNEDIKSIKKQRNQIEKDILKYPSGSISKKTINGKDTVSCSDVEDFLTHTRQETDFTLFSYIAYGKLESALECLQTLLHTNDSVTLATVLPSRLAGYFRKLISIHSNMAEGMSIEDAMKTKYFDSDRPIRMPKDKDFYRSADSNYSLDDTKRILKKLSEFDIQIKVKTFFLYVKLLVI